MSLHRSAFVTLLAAATFVAARPASAQTTIHTSLASFQASTSGPLYTETFPFVASALSFNFSSLGYAYTVTAPPTEFVYRAAPSGSFIGNSNVDHSLLFTFTSGNVTAIGGNFFNTNAGDSFISGAVNISLSDGTTLSFTSNSIADFRGFTTTGPAITSLLIAAPGVPGRFNSVDNLVIGTASTVVPEPSTYLLMATGLAGLFGVARRKNRTR